ncbi:MAG: DUF4136 domain-containing protein [Robiginitalea sp.]
MRKYIPMLLLILVMGCAPVRVQYDYDSQVRFDNYSSYNFTADLNTGLSDLDQRRLLQAVNRGLQERGLTLSEDPDLILDIYSNIYQDPNQGSVGFGVGGTGGDVGGGVSVGVPLNMGQLQREIIFEMIDARQGRTLWQAVSTDQFNEEMSPQKREERFKAIADKVFEGYPPGQK